MSKKQISITKFVSPLLAARLLVAFVLLKSTPVAKAHIVPTPCDFTTGGGFVITDNSNHANFGLVGGCKNGGFFGHANFVSHDSTGMFGLHVNSDTIDGTLSRPPARMYGTSVAPPKPTTLCSQLLSSERGPRTTGSLAWEWISSG